MNQQPQQKASNKRTGKKITFFNDQQCQQVSGKEAQLKDQQFYGPVTRLPVSQASDLSKSDNMMNTAMYPQERPDAVRVNQQPVPSKWNSQERSDQAWQGQPANMWHRNTAGYGVPMVNTYYNQQELLKRSQDKGVGVSQVEMYEDEIQQMRSKQVAQLQQQAFARQQAHLNSILHAQQQQQQQQNQQLSLQPFQMAFGHQGQKHALQEFFHVFPDAASSAAYATQQKQQTALPQMQLFENFYPSQQQQQQAPYGMQQAVSVAQSHGALQQKMHVVSQSQHAPPSEEYMKALAEQSQQSVLPKTQIPLPRRSRRLSKEGVPPLAPSEMAQTNNPYTQNPYEHSVQQHTEAQERYKRGIQQQIQRDVQIPIQDAQYFSNTDLNKLPPPQNGSSTDVQKGLEHNTTGAVTGGVIQTTRRRRRISQEANLFTLAQKAAEMPSLENTKDGDMGDKKKNMASKSSVEFPGSTKRAKVDSDMRPLVIPVSVPVKMDSGREKAEDERTQKSAAFERDSSVTKPSVIVTRHKAGHTNLGLPESTLQANDGSQASEGETPSRKPKQRPRPEPLFIPPKPGTFIVPVVYSNITPYQSHLRSPVRVPDHPGDRNFELPPYTPPPILSPVREGSGLYFNTILSAGAMPPPITPKSSTRTLLRSNSTEDMPPLLTAIGEATPVSIEPRINIGPRFQADIPGLRDRSLAIGDKHKADLVWWPWEESEDNQGKVEELLTAACSSILPGGGTNQELALHYLHESRGNILAALTKLLLKKPLRSRNHPLADYHYSGSDRWSVSEKRLFNKGMAIYKKDFLLVQKLIKTKTVAQCVEFYYTYKKQVKIGRNGMLIFGDVEGSGDERNPREDSEVDIKSSQRLAAVTRRDLPNQDSSDEEKESMVQIEETIDEEKKASLPPKITQTLEARETGNDTIILRNQGPDTKMPKPRGRKPRKKFPPDGIKKPEAGSKPQEPEGIFPCKKCGRVFLKVKSRSAHMKSHAEQEKKAAAQRQNELAAAQAAAQAAAHARLRHAESSENESSTSDGSDSSSESYESSDDGEI